MSAHHRILWILQWAFGLYFIGVGVMHFIVPDGLPEAMSWMYDLSDGVHAVAGTAEILGGLGLILPSLTRILPGLTVVAAIGLAVVMVAAAAWHAGRGEVLNIAIDLINAAVLAYVAFGRWRIAPISPRAPATATG